MPGVLGPGKGLGKIPPVGNNSYHAGATHIARHLIERCHQPLSMVNADAPMSHAPSPEIPGDGVIHGGHVAVHGGFSCRLLPHHQGAH
jgi:hypothetical protein